MERWLQLEIACELGIAANIEFELPAAFAWSILRDAMPDLSKESGYSPAKLRWHLFEALPEFSEGGDAAEVRRFLADGNELKRFELADRLANIYDRCVNFRDDWIREWERGKTPHWQARLWQTLTGRVHEQHWVHALDAFEKELAQDTTPQNWPRRVFIFGVSALSPSYLNWLRQLGKKIELHVFLLNPSEAYWSDLRTQREIQRRAKDSNAEDQHFEEGNRLLAAWGRAGREMFDSLAEEAETRATFPESSNESCLAAVQSDIQVVSDRPDKIPPDNSIQIHCCHSAMREAEVLHDRLLDLLETHDDIQPADILILTPDPARYGPAVAAVFEAEGRIPMALSRSRAVDSPTARAFFDLLSLPGTRFGVEAMLAPLDAPSLRARFDIEESALPDIREWVKQAGIRRNLASEGESAPILPGNTWRDGFNRLLVGYAAGDADELALGIAPCSIRGEGGFEAGEEDYATMGRIISYCNEVFALRDRVARPGDAERWTHLIRDALRRFFDNGSRTGAYGSFGEMREAGKEYGEVAMLIDSFAEQAGRINCAFSFEVVRKTLLEAAASPAIGPARLTDAATVGRLTPGQILPAKIICAVGMNGGGFPRNPQRHTFDIVEREDSRPGDRDARHEDRFAFLETLISARNAFIVTYTGRNQSDDSDVQPSVVVDELHEYLTDRFPAPPQEGEAPQCGGFRFDHPLQPFSARYFSEGEGLFSYSHRMFEAARMLREQQRELESGRVQAQEEASEPEQAHEPAPGKEHGENHAQEQEQDKRMPWPNRFDKPLEPPDAMRRKVSLNELGNFFANPAGGFLRERFAVRLRDKDDVEDDVEPLQLNGYEQWGLRQEILTRTDPQRENKVADEKVEVRLLANGKLPHGGFGGLVWDEAFNEVNDLRQALIPYAELLAAEPQYVDLGIGDFRLMGAIPYIGEKQMLYWRNGKKRAKDLIEIRLRQLAWMAAGNEPLPMTGIWLHKENGIEEVEFPAPDPHRELIGNWLEAWWLGLSQPLRFFPKSSVAYARELGKDPEKNDAAMYKAKQAWRGGSWNGEKPECDEPDNGVVWDLGEDDDPLADPPLVLPDRTPGQDEGGDESEAMQEKPDESRGRENDDQRFETFSGLAEMLLAPMFGSKPE